MKLKEQKIANNEVMVSIIIPMYNTEGYIYKCLNSIIKQSYTNLEIIVVDDGSRDHGLKIAKEFANKDRRIIIIESDNRGVAAARTSGIRIARGEYLLFVDSDDYVDEKYVEILLSNAIAQNADLVICGYCIEKNGKKKEVVPRFRDKFNAEVWAYRLSSTWSRLYKKAFWEDNNFQFVQEDNARAEDLPIAISSVYRADSYCVVPYAGYYYVQRSDSAMNRKTNEKLFGFPYRAFLQMYYSNRNFDSNNSEELYYIAILKAFAMFEFVILKNATEEELSEFREYIGNLLCNDWKFIKSIWWKNVFRIKLPIVIKCAITLFLLKNRDFG